MISAISIFTRATDQPFSSRFPAEQDDGRKVSTVLLIEDNRSDIFLVKEAIRAHNLEVLLKVMEDGEQAIAFINNIDEDAASVRPDLFVLDLNLPKISGSQVLAHIRKSQKCSHVPIIVVSSSDLVRDRMETLEASAYFRKPTGYQDFLLLGDLMRKLLTK